MPRNTMLGKTVALTQCPGHNYQGKPVKLSGLFDIEDGDGDERGNNWFLVVPHGVTEAQDADWYDIDVDTLWEQYDPKGYGRYIVAERELEFEDEREHVVLTGCTNVEHNAVDCNHAGLPRNKWCQPCLKAAPVKDGNCPCGLPWNKCAGMDCLAG